MNDMMKYIILFFALSLNIYIAKGQTLTYEQNAFCTDDEIEKQEVNYVSPLEGGKDLLWDYRNIIPLADISNEVILSDTAQNFLFYDGFCSYRYNASSEGLYCLGYDAPNLRVNYLLVDTLLTYPFSYGDSISSLLYGEGIYSDNLYMAVYGKTYRKADAAGKLLVPEKDTLHHVLRIHEHALLSQALSHSNHILKSGNVSVSYADSILLHLDNDSLKWCIDTYSWYVEGYRYPVFRTIETNILRHGIVLSTIRKSYIYSLDCMDGLYDEHNLQRRTTQEYETLSLQGVDGIKDNPDISYTFSDDGRRVSFNVVSNPGTHISLQLTTIQGIILHRIPDAVSDGIYSVTLPLPDAAVNTYLVTLFIEGKPQTIKISR